MRFALKFAPYNIENILVSIKYNYQCYYDIILLLV